MLRFARHDWFLIAMTCGLQGLLGLKTTIAGLRGRNGKLSVGKNP
jgi:hypothetical protein